MIACSMFLPVISFGIILTILYTVMSKETILNAKLHTLVGLSKCFTYNIRIEMAYMLYMFSDYTLLN